MRRIDSKKSKEKNIREAAHIQDVSHSLREKMNALCVENRPVGKERCYKKNGPNGRIQYLYI